MSIILPPDLVHSFLSHLDSYNLVKSSRVCKTWYICGNDENLWETVILNELKLKECSDRVFGRREWEAIHGIKTSIPYPKNLCNELDKPSPFFKGKTVGQSSYVQCTVFNEIDTCEKLAKLVQGKTGYFNNMVLKEKEPTSKKDAWYIIPETILPNSTSKKLNIQIMQATGKDPSYRVATVFEISLVAFNHYLLTNKLMLNECFPLYTRAFSMKKHFIVGAYQKPFNLTVLPFSEEIEVFNAGIMPIKQL